VAYYEDNKGSGPSVVERIALRTPAKLLINEESARRQRAAGFGQAFCNAEEGLTLLVRKDFIVEL
jgi:hypothetical protein